MWAGDEDDWITDFDGEPPELKYMSPDTHPEEAAAVAQLPPEQRRMWRQFEQRQFDHFTLGARTWAHFGHRIAPYVRAVLDDPFAVVQISADWQQLVQVRGSFGGHCPNGAWWMGRNCYAEAASHNDFGCCVTPRQRQGLLRLGWTPWDVLPRGDCRRENEQHWAEFAEPVDVYRLVLLLATTLDQVLGVRPDQLEVLATVY